MTSDSEPLEDTSHSPSVLPFSLTTCPTPDSLRRFRVTELRTLLSSRALNTAGKKDELIKRLWESVQAEQVVQAMDQEEEKEHAISGSSTGITNEAGKGAKERKLGEETAQEIKKNVLPAFKIPPAGKPSVLPHAKPATTSPETAAAPVTSAKAVDEEQKKEARAQRFISETDVKKQARAERFGVSSTKDEGHDIPIGDDDESRKKKLRTDRFGESLSSSSPSNSKANKKTALDTESLAKLRERQARFGETSSRALARYEAEEVKQKRAERFASS